MTHSFPTRRSSDLRRAIAPPSALRAATSPWLRHREDRILAKRRLTRAVDVEFLARAIGIRVRDEPQHRSGNIGGIGDAAEGEFGVEMVDIVLSGDRARQF